MNSLCNLPAVHSPSLDLICNIKQLDETISEPTSLPYLGEVSCGEYQGREEAAKVLLTHLLIQEASARLLLGAASPELEAEMDGGRREAGADLPCERLRTGDLAVDMCLTPLRL